MRSASVAGRISDASAEQRHRAEILHRPVWDMGNKHYTYT